MSGRDPRLREAVEADAPVLARLVNFAGEGMPEHLWRGLAEGSGRDPWEIGAERQRSKIERDTIIVVDEGDGAVAGLTGYVAAEDDPTGAPAMFVPLIELENMVPGSWYVNVLATVPEARGRGLGTLLLAEAERLAKDAGCSEMSVIVADANEGARRLYERTGYREQSRRDAVREGWQTQTREWVLLNKPLA